MEKRIIELYRRKFDDIRHEADGIEYWYARELMKLLDYVQWRNFDNAVNKAMLSCENNGNLIGNHFSKINSTIVVGNGARRKVEEKDLQGETAITVEHVENNTSVRDMLGQRGIKPENLPASEDIKKLERRVKREEKKLAEQSWKLINE